MALFRKVIMKQRMKNLFVLSFLTFAVAAWTNSATAEGAKKEIKGLLDVSYDRNQGDYGTPTVQVHLNANTVRALKYADRVIEVRLYSGEKAGQEERIHRKDGSPYVIETNAAKANYTFPPSVACPKPGNYHGKIWLDVKNRNGDKLEDDKNWETKELRFPYTCYNRDARDLDVEKAKFDIGQRDKRTNYITQLNFLVWVGEKDFNALNKEEGGVKIEFFAYRDGQKVPVGKEEGYVANQRKSSFTLPIDDICGKARSWWEDEQALWNDQQKEVDLSYEITALYKDGNPSYSYYKVIASKSDRFQVTCMFGPRK